MKLLRLSEVAEILDVPLPRAYEMARRGMIPVIRLGRQLRVNPSHLQDWMASGGRPLSGGWRRDADV
jgi:excisionase family DNA binding protein